MLLYGAGRTDSCIIIIIIIFFTVHTRTEHKIQKLNNVKEIYGRLPEKLQLIELAAYANQTKLFSMNCNNNEMLAPSACLASAASTLVLQQSILPDSIWMQGDQSVASTETLWTGLANSPKPSQQTQHIQKAWDGPVAASQTNLILFRAPSDVDKARLLAAAYPHSGDWLHAPQITAVGLRLSDEAVRVAVAHRLGSKACEPQTCVCGSGCTWAAWTILPQKRSQTTTSQSFE